MHESYKKSHHTQNITKFSPGFCENIHAKATEATFGSQLLKEKYLKLANLWTSLIHAKLIIYKLPTEISINIYDVHFLLEIYT